MGMDEIVNGWDATQGQKSLEEAIVMTVSAPQPWRSQLPTLAKNGALDAILEAPVAKKIDRKLPDWAKSKRSLSMALARLCLSPGDCSFAKRATQLLPGGRGIWISVVAMLSADAPESLASAGEPGWMRPNDVKEFVVKFLEYRSSSADAIRGLQALIDSEAWRPKSPEDWNAPREALQVLGRGEAAAWLAVYSERAALRQATGLVAGPRARSASL